MLIIRMTLIGIAAGFCIGCELTPIGVKDVPTDWPHANDPACSNIVGSYRDPNTERGRVTIIGQERTLEYGGTHDQAWKIFGFEQEAKPLDDTIANRFFTISQYLNGDLGLAYYANGARVAEKSYSKKELRCQNGVMQFMADSNENVSFDKGSRGSTKTYVEIIRSKHALHIKRTLVMKTYFSLIPLTSSVVDYQIFPVKMGFN